MALFSELPPGLLYLPNWLTDREQDAVLREIDSSRFDTSLLRRVQHYGAKYNYESSAVEEIGSAPQIPLEMKLIGNRLVDEGYFDRQPDQVIVNEYIGSQGIASHKDRESFGEAVASVSLLESWPMVFHGPFGEKNEVLLERGSLAVMTGPSRHEWSHEIPKRKSEKVDGLAKRVIRGRRLSLTFRTINEPPKPR